MPVNPVIFYIGTFTDKSSKGIYGIKRNPETGEFSDPELYAEAVSPTYLAANTERTALYAACEPTDGSNGRVMAFRIEPSTGHLRKINEVQAPGRGLCHILMDVSGSWLFGISYADARVQVYPLEKDSSVGKLACMQQHFGQGVHPVRQEKAHTHFACLTPDSKYLCVCDLGLDMVVVYRFNRETGQLERDSERTLHLPAGCGPRHMVFHPNGRVAYVVTELSSQVIELSYSGEKGFDILQIVNALPAPNPDATAAAIRIDRDGRYLYTSNRGEDSISLFRVDANTGHLTHISNTSTQGRTPRDFLLDHTGSFLLCSNQDTDNLMIYRVSSSNGTIAPIREIKGVSMPVCILENSDWL
ncbi:MAG TPA: 6-phosphogluconolactonase [Clostridiales bacterium]|nr:6-phosphogluconolactonase [Clostridiales bacterium]